MAWPGVTPSTSMPNINSVRTESSICMRGSAEGSFERRMNMRPSSGFSLRALGKETEKLGPAACEQETRTPTINPKKTTLRLEKNIESPWFRARKIQQIVAINLRLSVAGEPAVLPAGHGPQESTCFSHGFLHWK